MDINPKPGWTTSEFWVTLLTILVTGGVSIGALFGLHFDQDHLLALVPTISTFAAAITAFAYAHSRAQAKTAHYEALSALNTAAPAVVSHGVVNVQTGASEV